MTLTGPSYLWHPFADMTAVAGNELLIDRAEGVWLWDDEGNRYLDATSGLWYANIGHGRERMAGAIAAQVRKLDVYSTFNDFTNAPAEALAAKLAEISPIPDSRIFLGTGGGDGIETAAKLARLHFALRGEPERRHIIGRVEGFHGAFAYGTSIGGIEANHRHFGALVRETSQVAADSVDALAAEIDAVGPDRVAAFFFEPVIGAGGVRFPPEGYLEGAIELCRSHGILAVADEVICAFGRLGEWFGAERFGVTPDMAVFAKGVTSGYLPLGGVVVAGEIAEPLWTGEPGNPFRHGATYAGHPTCCAAALTNLAIIEEEGLLARGRELEEPLHRVLRSLGEHPAASGARVGVGLLGAVEIDPALREERPGVVLEIHRAAREEGVMVRPLLDSIAVSPPLTIDAPELELIESGVRAALDRVVGGGA
ncbi:MAG TPA: aminotransferase class III-fold pyridoxal phosphate-dependent enzyme [Solirubrobacterales bacterium]|nr:aminotransferase class III-fold pyridoxal phosphate-dependent enzyme [Solirubrobacterales bacterium]